VQIPTKIRGYFLCQLNQSHIRKGALPIGHLQKPEGEKIAKSFRSDYADKKDSLRDFALSEKFDVPDSFSNAIEAKKGNIIVIPEDLEIINALKFQQEVRPEGFDQALFWNALAFNLFTYTARSGKSNSVSHNGAHYFTVSAKRLARWGHRENPFVHQYRYAVQI